MESTVFSPRARTRSARPAPVSSVSSGTAGYTRSGASSSSVTPNGHATALTPRSPSNDAGTGRPAENANRRAIER